MDNFIEEKVKEFEGLFSLPLLHGGEPVTAERYSKLVSGEAEFLRTTLQETRLATLEEIRNLAGDAEVPASELGVAIVNWLDDKIIEAKVAQSSDTDKVKP